MQNSPDEQRLGDNVVTNIDFSTAQESSNKLNEGEKMEQFSTPHKRADYQIPQKKVSSRKRKKSKDKWKRKI